MNDFYIKNINILNFRGYTGKTKYKFIDEEGNPYNIILLSGPNGYGKTTLLDSIEWCLTGNVKRVINDYNDRCSVKAEKTASSSKGLIRNINATNNDVIVQIEMIYKKQDVKIYRRFNGDNEIDAFEPGLTEFEIECSDNIVNDVKEILKYIKVDFNFNNICSYDKNIELYKKGRTDIYDFFESCYSEFYEAKKIIDNLVVFKGKLVDEKENKVTKLEEITEKRNSKQALLKTVNGIDNVKIREYPEIKVFDGEIHLDDSIIHNEKDDIEKKLNKQLNILTDIFNKKIIDNLKDVREKELWILELDQIIELGEVYKDKEEILNKVKNINFSVLNVEYKNIQLFKTNIIRNKNDDKFMKYLSSILSNIESEIKYIPKDKLEIINNNYKLIKKNLEILKVLAEEKQKYDSNSDIVRVMRYLVDNEQVYRLYGEKNDKCPLCGKDEFDKSEISFVAKHFLGKKDKERQEIIQKIKKYNDENKIYIDKIKEILQSSLDEKEKALEELIECKESLKELYRLARRFKFDVGELDINKISNKKTEIQKKEHILAMAEAKEAYVLELIKESKMPYLIRYNKEIEEYEDNDSDVKVILINNIISQLEKNINDVTNEVINDKYREIKLETIKDKLDITKDVISFKKSNSISMEISELNKKIQVYTKEIQSINNKVEKVTELIKIISKEKTESEKRENERIAKPLNDIYKKITRNTNIKEINLKKGTARNKSTLDVIDIGGNDTPFGNIMSTGQVSTLAIAMYLSKALLNRNSSFKLYLMDDPIQTMDDLNILSLIDLLRFQFMENEKNRFMNQLFISTCDEDLENLIYHKMSSFDIPIINENFMNRMLS
ncbi:MAG: AAA family ATPase [Clostridium paraputrificum]